ncbi:MULTISPECIES: hypothetical protein [unclassified Streptomyces]|uniref:hypothetical protein n=1 Tax=unclassified Streptomyces TaxID=2593676 RepID=UPI0036E964EA
MNRNGRPVVSALTVPPTEKLTMVVAYRICWAGGMVPPLELGTFPFTMSSWVTGLPRSSAEPPNALAPDSPHLIDEGKKKVGPFRSTSRSR